MSGEKFLTLEVWEKKFLPKLNYPYPPPTQKSNGNRIGGGEEGGEFDTLIDALRQQNRWRAFIGF